jgi:hypothetical protein
MSLVAQTSAACPNEKRASGVYDEGATALAEGRYNDAARLFAKADELCPHEVALGEAFRAVEAADNPIFCMELVDRAEQRDALPLRRAELKQTCETQVGQIVVRCPGSTCRASIDGQPAQLHAPVWVLNGKHVVDLAVDGAPVVPYQVEVRPGKQVIIPPEDGRPSPAPKPEPVEPAVRPAPGEDPSGLHPAFFVVGLGVTAVSGAVLVWSGVDTLGRNDDFKAAPSEALQQDGLDAQLRTNVLIGVTAGLGVLTAAFALFTDWGGDEDVPAVTIRVDPSSHAGTLAWRGSF